MYFADCMVLKIKTYLKAHKHTCLILLGFACVYAIEAFVNHLNFRTYALDLGAYTNALYDYSHFQFNDKGVFKDASENLLSDHFDLYLIVFSPLSLIFGQYTLQILQIVFILLAGIGVQKVVALKTKDPNLPLMALTAFFLFFGIYSALSFDYHSNVISACLFPWLIYSFDRSRYRAFLVVLFLMVIGKETISVWTFFICLSLMLESRKDIQKMRVLGVGALFSIVYFLVVLKWVMPAFANSGKYEHFKFHALGSDYNSALKFILTHPLEFIKVMFVNHSGDAQYDWVKVESYLFLLFSGGLFLIFRPAYLLMVLPVLVMKMCYDDPSVWSIDCHYSMEFAPVLTIGAFTVIAGFRTFWIRQLSALVALGCNLIITIRLMDGTKYWHDYNRLRLYQAHHYSRSYDTRKAREVLASIPEHAVVAAQTSFVPHLAWRDRCYQLPKVQDAEYIVISEKEEVTYPVDLKELNKIVNDSLASGRWERLNNTGPLVVIRKIKLK